jgi:hypothetical protein
MPNIQCNCGAVKLSLEGSPVAQFYCHCDDCQHVHGAGYVPVAMYRAEQVQLVSGEPTMWKLRGTPRASCGACGTRIFAEPPGLGMRAVMAKLLPEGSFQAQFHMQCAHALLAVRDGLPHFRGFPGAFGGSDEVVAW